MVASSNSRWAMSAAILVGSEAVWSSSSFSDLAAWMRMANLTPTLCCLCQLARHLKVANTETQWTSRCATELSCTKISSGRLPSTFASEIRISSALVTKSSIGTDRHCCSSSKVEQSWADDRGEDGWSLSPPSDGDTANSSTLKPRRDLKASQSYWGKGYHRTEDSQNHPTD